MVGKGRLIGWRPLLKRTKAWLQPRWVEGYSYVFGEHIFPTHSHPVFRFKLTHSHSSSFSSLWNELRIILHNRENTLVTQAVKVFAREEQEYAESVLRNWVSLGEVVENMPYEWLYGFISFLLCQRALFYGLEWFSCFAPTFLWCNLHAINIHFVFRLLLWYSDTRHQL